MFVLPDTKKFPLSLQLVDALGAPTTLEVGESAAWSSSDASIASVVQDPDKADDPLSVIVSAVGAAGSVKTGPVQINCTITDSSAPADTPPLVLHFDVTVSGGAPTGGTFVPGTLVDR